MGNFHLLRHGQADWDVVKQRLLGGSCDWVQVADSGIAAVESAAQKLSSRTFDVLVSSPMTRAMHTAALVNRRLALPIRVEFDLHEWLADITYRNHNTEYPVEHEKEMRAGDGEWPVGQTREWEPVSAVRQRARAALAKYKDFSNVLVVTHQVVIIALTGKDIAVATGIDVSADLLLGEVDVTSKK